MQLGWIHGYNYAISTLSWDISHDSYIDPKLHKFTSSKLRKKKKNNDDPWWRPKKKWQITFHPLFSTPHLDVEAAARDTAGATGYRGPAAAACAVAGVARLAWPQRFSWISSICYTIYIYIYIYTMYIIYIHTTYIYIYTYILYYICMDVSMMYLSVYVSSYLNSCWWSQWYSSTWILTVGKVNAFYVAVGQI